jgi:hypothetical protein
MPAMLHRPGFGGISAHVSAETERPTARTAISAGHEPSTQRLVLVPLLHRRAVLYGTIGRRKMIIIFGWLKETKPIRPLLDSYCYHCQKTTNWHLWRETEWVSFFAVKTVPFIWKNYVVCPGCEYVFPLAWNRYLQVASPSTQRGVVKEIESGQLSAKNALQRNFLLTQRAEREAREKSAA